MEIHVKMFEAEGLTVSRNFAALNDASLMAITFSISVNQCFSGIFESSLKKRWRLKKNLRYISGFSNNFVVV